MLYEVITLLLRALPGHPAVEGRLLGGGEHLHAEGDLPRVITSYSIHYTKLYEKRKEKEAQRRLRKKMRLMRHD